MNQLLSSSVLLLCLAPHLSEPVSVGIDPPSRTTPGADVDLCKCLLGYELITLDVSEFGTSQD